MDFLHNIVSEYAQTFISEMWSPWTVEAISNVCHSGILEHFESPHNRYSKNAQEWQSDIQWISLVHTLIDKKNYKTLGILQNAVTGIYPWLLRLKLSILLQERVYWCTLVCKWLLKSHCMTWNKLVYLMFSYFGVKPLPLPMLWTYGKFLEMPENYSRSKRLKVDINICILLNIELIHSRPRTREIGQNPGPECLFCPLAARFVDPLGGPAPPK